MDQSTLHDKIDSINWSEFAQPEWNESGSVSLALNSAAIAYDANSCATAYTKVLYALGNNHAGTYYPVVLAALPVFESMVQADGQWVQRIALCLIDDLFASFSPEPGYEKASLNGNEIDTEFALRSGALALCPVIQRLANSNGPNAQLACEIVKLMSENPGERR